MRRQGEPGIGQTGQSGTAETVVEAGVRRDRQHVACGSLHFANALSHIVLPVHAKAQKTVGALVGVHLQHLAGIAFRDFNAARMYGPAIDEQHHRSAPLFGLVVVGAEVNGGVGQLQHLGDRKIELLATVEAAQQHVVSEPEVRQGETAVDPGVPLQTLQCVACGTGQCHHRGSQTDERH